MRRKDVEGAAEMKDYVILQLKTPKAEDIAEKIRNNNGYCCCAIIKDEDTRCMCKDFRNKLNDPEFYGECYCGLFEKKKWKEIFK